MLPFERAQVATLGQRLAEEPHRLISLFGPRQTGKTTIVQQALRKISHTPQKYLAVDRPWPPATGILPFAEDTHLSPPREGDVVWLEERWVEAREEAARYGRSVLVVDEIQKIPGWSEAVKGLWDADRDSGCPLHVVVLGSAPLLMQSGLTESLTGRFESVPVTHWSFHEIADAFGLDLQQYLYFGAYPGAARYVSDEGRWRSYVANSIIEPTIERDILALTRVDKPALLRRLFELGTDYSGQELPTPRWWASYKTPVTRPRSLAISICCRARASWWACPSSHGVTIGCAPQAKAVRPQHGFDDGRLRLFL